MPLSDCRFPCKIAGDNATTVQAICWVKGRRLRSKFKIFRKSSYYTLPCSFAKLSVKDATSHCKILSDTVNNTNEIVKLVKFSPKRENLLGQTKSNIEMEDEEEGISASGLTKFCATRWTVRVTCFQRVIDNYDALLKLWSDCLETRLESDVRGRIIGCRAQMKKFDFFFGLNLSQRIFSHTDNLSETLQKADFPTRLNPLTPKPA